MTKLLLISEGPTDFYVIKKIASAISSKEKRNIDIQLFSPKQDATGKYEAHGWTGVQRTCSIVRVKSPDELAKLDEAIRVRVMRQNWRALMHAAGASGLIIQLDSDVASQIDPNNPFNPIEIHRKDYSEKVVRKWIGEKDPSPNLHFAICDMSVETWILATYDRSHEVFSNLPDDFKFSDLVDVEDRLINLGYPKKMHRGRQRLDKNPAEKYNGYGQKISDKLNVVKSECQCAADLIQYIGASV